MSSRRRSADDGAGRSGQRQRTESPAAMVESSSAPSSTDIASLPAEIWCQLVPLLHQRELAALRATCCFMRQAVDAYQPAVWLHIRDPLKPSQMRYLSCLTGLTRVTIWLMDPAQGLWPAVEDLCGMFVRCRGLRKLTYRDRWSMTLPLLARAILLAGRAGPLPLEKLVLDCKLEDEEAYLTPLAMALDCNCPILRSLDIRAYWTHEPDEFFECKLFLDLLKSLRRLRCVDLLNVPVSLALLDSFLNDHPDIIKLGVTFFPSPIALPGALERLHFQQVILENLQPALAESALLMLFAGSIERLRMSSIPLTLNVASALGSFTNLRKAFLEIDSTHVVNDPSVQLLVDCCGRLPLLIKLSILLQSPTGRELGVVDFTPVARGCRLLRKIKWGLPSTPGQVASILEAFSGCGHPALRTVVTWGCNGDRPSVELLMGRLSQACRALPGLRSLCIDADIGDCTTPETAEAASEAFADIWDSHHLSFFMNLTTARCSSFGFVMEADR